MFENFNENYLSVTKFFETLIQNENFAVPNSIILHGPDVIAQYHFALLLARGANCTGDKTQTCTCQNCRWIQANEHPEILTISKINSKPENDSSKTVISVKQIDMIKDKILISSDYHRFFIFCDAEIKEFSEEEKKKSEKFAFLNQKMPENTENWLPLGITRICFSDVVANALLKSIEEPPEDVTFIFLTESLENIISTIVSRSQAFYIPGNSKQTFDYGFLTDILKNYPNIDRNQMMKISDFLTDYAKENGLPISDIILSLQSFLKDLIIQNADNPVLKQKIFNDINLLQNALKMTQSSVREQTVADELGFILTK